ncbi:hypothetical protein MOV66_02435 [Agrobacterium sp. SHOUNA12C]|nr:hypothetical protein [Agrobacterium sp. BETTINA12B]MCJ9755490.1 hypothetical protein [Agrobacterium sp. SHOUNA12C]NTG34802.1 hypothetical protein [Rhizobium rhizogenes]NTG54051.1 hypothetical protein [Rhizobium rhizogenes]
MLRAHTTGTERRYKAVAAVENEGEWRMFLPFPGRKIQHTVLVGSNHVVCISDQAEVCLLEISSRREVAKRALQADRPYEVFVAPNAAFIVAYNRSRIGLPRGTNGTWYSHDFVVLNASDLGVIFRGDSVQLSDRGLSGRIETKRNEADPLINLDIVSEISQDSSGQLTFLCYHPNAAGVQLVFCRMDPSDWSLRFTPLPEKPMPLRWFSPNGTYALAPYLGSLGQSPTQDEVNKAYHRHKGVLELWKIDPPKLITRIETRKGVQPEFVQGVVWDTDGSGFWTQFDHRKNRDRREIEFQWLGLDGTDSPVFSFERFSGRPYASAQKIVDVSDLRQVEVRVHSNSVYIRRDWWESESSSKLIYESEDGFRENTFAYPPEALVKRFLAKSEYRHVVAIEEFSEGPIADALLALADDVHERLAELIQGDVFELSFKIGKRTITETAFFDRLIKESLPVVPSLRRLLGKYLEVQPAVIEAKRIGQIWGPENQGAFAPAMQALLLLDPSAHDVFRDYLAKRDGEHETHSTDVTMKRYIAKVGWRDTAMISFGIYFALIRHRDGRIAMRGGLLDEYDLLRAAEDMVEPQEFVALIAQEVDRFVVTPGLKRGSSDDLYHALQRSLEATEYGRQALSIISAQSGLTFERRTEERGWDPQLIKAIAQQRANRKPTISSWWDRLIRKLIELRVLQREHR